jgi:hypothetical protein
MRARVSGLLIVVATLVWAPRADAGATWISPGGFLALAPGGADGVLFAAGAEVSVSYYDAGHYSNGVLAFGAVARGFAATDGSLSGAIGAQVNYAFIGVELGWQARTSSPVRDAEHGPYVAPFLSMGYVHITIQLAVPLSGDGVEVMWILGFKAPVQIGGHDFLRIRF